MSDDGRQAGAVDAEVIVVGAGPVGLTLALDLGRRGIRTMLVERRLEPLRLPKMERTNPRSMEIYRRLGVAGQIRAQGLAPDKSMDTYMVASLARPPLARLAYPSVEEARARIAASRDGALPREPWQLISQYTLEPILFQHVRMQPSVQVWTGVELESFAQDERGVRARLRRLDSGAPVELRAGYLAGCDGAGSRVRALLEVGMEGRSQLGTLTNVFFRCDELLEKSRVPQGRHFQFVNEDPNGGAGGSIVMQDDLKHFAYHTASSPGSDPAGLLRRQTGLDIQPQVLHVGPWTQNMLVAERHARGRVFLAGDANHIGSTGQGRLVINRAILGALHEITLAEMVRPFPAPTGLVSIGAHRESAAELPAGR